MSIIAGPSSAPFRSVAATVCAATVVRNAREARRSNSTQTIPKPGTVHARERTCVVMYGVPRTFTSEDVHMRLKKIGALRKADIPLTSIISRFRPFPPNRSQVTMPQYPTTTFHLTFPNASAAEYAQKVIHTKAGRVKFLDVKEDRPNANRKSTQYSVEASAINAVTAELVKQDAKGFWASTLQSHINNNHFFRSGRLTSKPSKETEEAGSEEEKARRVSNAARDAEGRSERQRTMPERMSAREGEFRGIVDAFKQARIGPFGTDDKMIRRGETPRSGRQVVLYGLPETAQAHSLKPILEGFKLDESDPLFDVPIRAITAMKTFIITLVDVAEAHRFVRKINMQDVSGGEGLPSIVRADIMW